MAGAAAGGFVTRSLESMHKECSGKKYTELQKSIQTCLENLKEKPTLEKSFVASTLAHDRADNTGVEEGNSNNSLRSTSTPNEADAAVNSNDNIKPISFTLSSAGQILDEIQAEVVLQPVRLAFETKNLKLMEPALDCLHKLIAYDHLEGDPGMKGGESDSLYTTMLNMVCGCVDDSSPESTILQVLKVLLTAVASTRFRVHGEPLLGVIRVCYNIALNSKSPINLATSKAMLTQMISIVVRRMESDQVPALREHAASSGSHNSDNTEIASDNQDGEDTTLGEAQFMDKMPSPTTVEVLENLAGGADIKGLEAVLDKAVYTEDGKKILRGIDLESVSVAYHDALLLFRTLCKMSMKEESDEVTTKTRLLSLELLKGLLEGVSQSFTTNYHFIDSVKAYLCYALLRASVSSYQIVFQYATGIFTILLLRFRESLKAEIGIFFPLIVLRYLDNADSSPSHRTNVLRMLEQICKDPQMLADIFVNYDCDLEAENLFERMVNALSRITQGILSFDSSSAYASQIASIKGSSLQCLVSVLKALVDWEKLRESEKHGKAVSSLHVDVSIQETYDDLRNRDDAVYLFEKAKVHKSTLETAISEFNRRPAKGLEYLLSNNLVESTPQSVAHFLKASPGLNKAMIGEYLGQHDDFPLAVMNAYVDSMNFSGLKFDAAIREFLKGFRLPGEAQKIDRIMEKFAERYCFNNPGLFKNADTAYVLAYAVIMLNTDAHNPMIWPKMSKSEFTRMNTSGDAEEHASKELLEDIYDSIVRDEITLKGDADTTKSSSRQRPESEERGRLINILNLAFPRRFSGVDSKAESELIINQTQELFKRQGVKRGIFYKAQQVALVRPMVESVGWPLLATFSVIMEEGDNRSRVLLCMEGFKAGVHITHILGMDTMRYAFLTSLVRLTYLHSPKEMRSKNVEAIRAMLDLCDSDIDSLRDTWNAVLECVSRLEFITSTPAISLTVMQGSNQISRDAVLQSLKDLAEKPIEKLFENSANLPSDIVVEFFAALCGVSAEELKQTPARVFSLQKLVEISYYNMDRIRLVWARIWSVLAQHFISAGSHREEKVAMYAIDSLRQLGMKYLGRDELINFTFQNDILKPFVILMRNSWSENIRALIVDCVVQMISSKVARIKSGWRSVFMIFTAAADDELESIVEKAFENVEQVILEHFDQVVGDCFMDCVNCLIRFANNKMSSRISLKSIALLRICEDRLAEGLVPGGALKPVEVDPETNVEVSEHYWFPMLAGLSDLTLDSRSEIRNCALEVLFDLLNERGHMFSSSFWESIFDRVLFPIFDHVRYAGKDGFTSSGGEWIRETSIHSLQLLCNLFNTFYKEVCFMLPPLLSLLLDCAKKTDQTVVSISLGALVHLLEVGGHQFSDNDWDTLLKGIRDASYTTQPVELFNSLGFENVKNQMLLNNNISISLHKTYDKDIHYGGSDGTGACLASVSSDKKTFGNNATTTNLHHDKELQLRDISDETDGLQRSQTFGQRIVGNMMDNLFLRNMTSKSKTIVADAFEPSSPAKTPEDVESTRNEDDEDHLMETLRSKCVTQLLLLGVLNSIQMRYWYKLKASQKIVIMDILQSLLEFAASYNTPPNLRMRMQKIPPERPPLNLLRQELAGTSIYLDVLQKSTSTSSYGNNALVDINDPSQEIELGSERNYPEPKSPEKKIKFLAEEKLVSFCGQILKDASDLQSGARETVHADVHRVLNLRAPVIIRVLKGMCLMEGQIFKSHLREFYPLITKLVCCDQMDVRGALSDLMSIQLVPLLP